MDDQALLPKTIFDERFEILELAGSGGMGNVYRARHKGMDKLVAIKLLRRDLVGDVEATKRFRREAQMVRDLKHRNIAPVNFFGISEGQPYIVFDFLEGETLNSVLDRQGKLSYAQFLPLFKQVCAGLAHAHRNGVVHRDLKPDNIFLIAGDEVKILDFGIAKIIQTSEAEAQRLTGTGALLGTPLYMSPEQGRSEPVSYQSDIYSLGCVMFHCCFGKPPFSGDSAYQILFNHTYEQPPLNTVPAGYPKGILVILSKCLSKDAVDRYADMNELSEALANVESLKLNQSSLGMKAIVRSTPSKSNVSAIPWKLLGITTVVAVGVAAAVWAIVDLTRSPSDHSLSPEQIKAAWSVNRNPTTLRQRFRELASVHPDQAQQLMKDLHHQLLANPCYETAAMFLDEANLVEEGRHDEALKPELDDCAFILRELPAEAWSRADANPIALVKDWTDYRRSDFTKNGSGMIGMYLALAMKLDGNDVGSNAVSDFSMLLFSRNNDFNPHETGSANNISDRLWSECRSAGNALRLLELADSTRKGEVEVHVPNLIKRAQIYDGLHQMHKALPLWKEAVTSCAPGSDIAIYPRLNALLGLTDDQVASGDSKSALTNYQQVMSEAMKLPPQSYRWNTLARLGDAYTVLHEYGQAGKAYTQGLADCRDFYALPADNYRLEPMRQQALVSMARFLTRLGRPEEAWPLFEKAQDIRLAWEKRNDLNTDKIVLDGSISPGVVQDQIACLHKIATLSGSAQKAASAEYTGAVRDSLAAEWCEFRGDLEGCALYHESAARYCRRVIGDDAHGNMVVATQMRNLNHDFSLQMIEDATQALRGLKNVTEICKVKLMLGHALLAQGKDEAARGFIDSGLQPIATAREPQTVRAWYDLGVIDLNAKQVSKAKAKFQSGYGDYDSAKMKTDVNFRRLAFHLIQLLRSTHDESGAIERIQRFKRDCGVR